MRIPSELTKSTEHQIMMCLPPTHSQKRNGSQSSAPPREFLCARYEFFPALKESEVRALVCNWVVKVLCRVFMDSVLQGLV